MNTYIYNRVLFLCSPDHFMGKSFISLSFVHTVKKMGVLRPVTIHNCLESILKEHSLFFFWIVVFTTYLWWLSGHQHNLLEIIPEILPPTCKFPKISWCISTTKLYQFALKFPFQDNAPRADYANPHKCKHTFILNPAIGPAVQLHAPRK